MFAGLVLVLVDWTHPNSKAGVPYVFLLRTVCTSGAPISITKVTASHPTGGMTVAYWGIRRRHPGPRYTISVPLRGPVSQMPGFGHHPVTVKCHDKVNVDTLAISVTRTSPEYGSLQGVVIDYGSGQQMTFQFGIATCSGKVCKQP